MYKHLMGLEQHLWQNSIFCVNLHFTFEWLKICWNFKQKQQPLAWVHLCQATTSETNVDYNGIIPGIIDLGLNNL